MKQKISLISLVLILLLACGTCASAAEEDATAMATPEATFVFHNGIAWDTTMEQLKDIMGEVKEDDYHTEQFGELTLIAYNNIAYQGDEEIPGAIGFYYLDEQLVIAARFFPAETSETYPARVETLALEYGKATESGSAHPAQLFTALGVGPYDESVISNSAGWALSDGTYAYLLDNNGEVSLFFFNAPVLMGDAE